MARESAESALAEGHSASGRDRNRDPQRDPLRLLCADPVAIEAARQLAESVSGNTDRIAAIFLLLKARSEAKK